MSADLPGGANALVVRAGPTAVRYVVSGVVVEKVERVQPVARAYKSDPGDPGSEVVVERDDLGWFVKLRGSHEALSIGHGEPLLRVGDKVRVIIERE